MKIVKSIITSLLPAFGGVLMFWSLGLILIGLALYLNMRYIKTDNYN